MRWEEKQERKIVTEKQSKTRLMKNGREGAGAKKKLETRRKTRKKKNCNKKKRM